MKISAPYAETRFPDVLKAAEKGQEIVIARPGKPNLVLVPRPEQTSDEPKRTPVRELLGIWEGQFHVPGDEEWDEIKKAFNADMRGFSPLER